MPIDIRLVGPDRIEDFIRPITTAFGTSVHPERLEYLKRVTELDTRIGAFDGDKHVGSAGVFAFDMSTTGGHVVKTAGLTMVAVMPTHRRRGVLSALMRRHLDEARARGQSIAALWASEAPIYGRYGYGLASFAGDMSIERDRSAFVGVVPRAEARFVSEEEAMIILPTLWDRARQIAPGMPSRSESWWKNRRLLDIEAARAGFGPLQRTLFTIDGQPHAYALYRTRMNIEKHDILVSEVKVLEAIGATPEGTRAAWRYLCDLDLAGRIEASNIPVDHPLFLLLAEPRRARYTAHDALWVRIVDVETALASRAYSSSESVVLEIEDTMCPWNSGRFRLDGASGRAQRTQEHADLRLPISSLGSAYLGGISFSRLAEVGSVEAKTEGAIERADRIFRSARAPWCPEIF
ncbi:MAG: GNAT family N-acetyltransferase [Polyangiaceae bacterium]|nr:GNAT family N-acetyltransferase [Polyangiaceae bacterium]